MFDLKIRKVTVQGVPPLDGESHSFLLSPVLTIIRGDNGAGKTTILEALAMLGHCSIMQPADVDRPECPTRLVFDVVLRRTADAPTPTAGGPPERAQAIDELRRLEASFDSVADGGVIRTRVVLLSPGGAMVDDLKAALQKEAALGAWGIWSPDGHHVLLQDIIRFSRPAVTQEERTVRHALLRSEINAIMAELQRRDWHGGARPEEVLKHVERTIHGRLKVRSPVDRDDARGLMAKLEDTGPRFSVPLRRHLLGCDVALPGIVSYVNTDMYHWGLGLDIRESPKFMEAELPGLIRDRLGITEPHPDRPGAERVIGFDRVRDVWESVYDDPHYGERLADVFLEGGQGKVLIGKDTEVHGGVHRPRRFMSSGENQVFSLGLILGALEPAGSLMMLDEPELHMSIPAAHSLYNMLVTNAILSSNQIVMVTHLPYLFREALHDEVGDSRWGRDGAHEQMFDHVQAVADDWRGQILAKRADVDRQEQLVERAQEGVDRSARAVSDALAQVTAAARTAPDRAAKQRIWRTARRELRQANAVLRKARQQRQAVLGEAAKEVVPSVLRLHCLRKERAGEGVRIAAYSQRAALDELGQLHNRELLSMESQAFRGIPMRDLLRVFGRFERSGGNG